MNTKLTEQQTKDLKKVMSLLGKISHQKSPRSKEMMKKIGEKGRMIRREKCRLVREARQCTNCKTIEEHIHICKKNETPKTITS